VLGAWFKVIGAQSIHEAAHSISIFLYNKKDIGDDGEKLTYFKAIARNVKAIMKGSSLLLTHVTLK